MHEELETETVVMTREEFDELDSEVIVERLNDPVVEDADQKDWNPATLDDDVIDKTDRLKALGQIRDLAIRASMVRRALKLYRCYIFGREFTVSIEPRDPEDATSDAYLKAKRSVEFASRDFLRANRKRWTLGEVSDRYYRDAEVFSLKKKNPEGVMWPPEIGFVDPEDIEDEQGKDEDQGIITEPNDITEIISYRRVDPRTGKTIDVIPAEDMFYFKDNADSTTRRGTTRFFSVIEDIRERKGLLRSEVKHRKLQASLVLVRKVKGSPAKAQTQMDNAATSTTKFREGTKNREKWRPGTILTVNEGTDITFQHPQSNFSDASPLFGLLTQEVGQATGWPATMLSVDTSDSGFASSLVQESPVNVMVECEQDDQRANLTPVFEWVIGVAIETDQIEGQNSVDEFWNKYELTFRFPTLISKDMLKEGQRINLATMNSTMSPQEGSRQQGLDPEKMREEIQDSQAEGMGMAMANTPGITSQDNNTGTNQDRDGTQTSGDDTTNIARRGG